MPGDLMPGEEGRIMKSGTRVRIVEHPERFRSSWVAAAAGTAGTVVGPAAMRQRWDDPESAPVTGYYWFEADQVILGTSRWIVKDDEIQVIPQARNAEERDQEAEPDLSQPDVRRP
jgi:hypothetical protein